MPGATNLKNSGVLESLVKKQAADGRLYAAVCASPAVVLGGWGLLKDLKVRILNVYDFFNFLDMILCTLMSSFLCLVVDKSVCIDFGQATCYPSFMEQLSSTANAVESRVQVDGKVVTSRGPGTTMEYAVALVEQLYGKEKAQEVSGPLVWSSSLFVLFYFLFFIYIYIYIYKLHGV